MNEEDLFARVFVELSGLETSGQILVSVSTGEEGDTALGKDILHMLGVTCNTL